jgi:hypothetical protein
MAYQAIGGVNNSTHNTHIEITDFFNRSTNVLERLAQKL